MKVVILTGAELRHDFVRKAIALAPNVTVLRSYCETKSFTRFVEKQEGPKDNRLDHLRGREESERDFFAAFALLAPDQSNPVRIEFGAINDPRHAEDIAALEPDLLVA